MVKFNIKLNYFYVNGIKINYIEKDKNIISPEKQNISFSENE